MAVTQRMALWLFSTLLLGPCATAQQIFPSAYPAASANTTNNSGESAAPIANIAVSSAQQTGEPASDKGSFWPRPYAYGGLALNQGGYSAAAGTIGGGLNVETLHFIALTEGWVENAPKQNSGSGSEVGVRARSFYRTAQGWYFGGGAQWSALSTTAYSKQAWRPAFGGGKDMGRENFSLRAQVLYVLPGSDHLNAVQGPEISLWLPSPASRSHFFYRQTIGLYEFHQTAVPGNPGTGDRFTSNSLEFTAMYRF